MPRPERHPVDKILDVSRDLVLRDGARGVTVDRIVARSGAPKGSVYHRFSSVNDLLATMWLRGVRRSQARFLEPLNAGGDPMSAAVAAGLAIHDFATENPADARLLAAMRREDLVGEVSDRSARRRSAAHQRRAGRRGEVAGAKALWAGHPRRHRAHHLRGDRSATRGDPASSRRGRRHPARSSFSTRGGDPGCAGWPAGFR